MVQKHFFLAALLIACAAICSAPTAALAARAASDLVTCDNSGHPCVTSGRQAQTATRRGHHHRQSVGSLRAAGYITIQTAAGVDITVAPAFADPAAGVIAGLVAAGFTPKKITCLSYARSHVADSRHFRGEACDVAQCGWGCTPAPKQIMRMIVARHGLRDGCEFRDSGHFDAGEHLPRARIIRNCGREYADAIGPSSMRQTANNAMADTHLQ